MRTPLCLSFCEAGNTLTDPPVSIRKRLADLLSTINDRLISWPAAEATTGRELFNGGRFQRDTGSVVSHKRTQWVALPGRVDESPVVVADVGRMSPRLCAPYSSRRAVSAMDRKHPLGVAWGCRICRAVADLLGQPCARRGPRAGSGPRPDFVRPARCS